MDNNLLGRKRSSDFSKTESDKEFYSFFFKEEINISDHQVQTKINSFNNIKFDPINLNESIDEFESKKMESVNKNSSKLDEDFNKFNNINIGDMKTNEITKIKAKEKKDIYKIEILQTIPEIKKKPRPDNDIIKIRRAVFKSYREELNEKIKDENLQIKEFLPDKVEDNSISTNSKLFNMKWKNIIINYSIGNNKVIKCLIDKKENDIIEFLEMTFGKYMEKFINNNWEQFEEKEKNNQIKSYQQRKFKKIINQESSDNNIQNLEYIKSCVSFGVKNKSGQIKLGTENKENNIFQKFEESNYKITKEKKFIDFIKSLKKYENTCFDITIKELEDINNYIANLKDKANKYKEFFNKKPRKRRKNLFKLTLNNYINK